jgi:primosomal protein N' (replication factor Y)
MANSLQPSTAEQKMTAPRYASVILELAIHKALDYAIPDELASQIKRGVKVEVPLRGKMRVGYVFEVKESSSFPRVLPISRVLSDGALIDEQLFNLALWMARYYCTPLHQVIQSILPAGIRKETKHKQQLYVMRAKTKEQLAILCQEIRNRSPAQAAIIDAMLQVQKGILLTELLEETNGSRSSVDALVAKGALLIDIVRIDRSPLVNEDYFQTKHKTLNPEQAEALSKINEGIAQNRFETHLIYGVTGSGKTEVYLQAIDKCLQQDRGVIMLVPEISLTAQTIERFRSRFEGKIAILHHRLSPGERFDEWHRVHRGEAQIVIGARSAIFSPMPRLGLIIVDEEHEGSYKQTEEHPCYHARDVAVMRGKISNSVVLLGSATPSLESFYNARSGKYILSTLKARASKAVMPQMTIVDMKREFEKAKGYTAFSEVLLRGIEKRRTAGEQTILFLNRRGYHTTLMCKTCSHVIKCRHCDVSLTFHRGDNHLACHLCGFQIAPPPAACPECKQESTMKFRGVGTEQIERALHAIFPDIRTLRVDADTTKHKGSHQRLLRDFASGKADVLVGTQMIAKGLHFPQVTLVGVLNSDGSLNIPDFRASETVFQLITQVAGRSGRGMLAGEVVLQTSIPDHSIIQQAAQQNFEAFYEEEMEVRKLFNYPPYCQLAKIVFSGKSEHQVKQVGESVRQHLLKQLPGTFELNPMLPAAHAKVKDMYRFQFLIKCPQISPLSLAIENLHQQMQLPSGIKMGIDINPSSTFF